MPPDRLDHFRSEDRRKQRDRLQLMNIVVPVDGARCMEEVADIVEQGSGDHRCVRSGGLGKLRALQGMRQRADWLGIRAFAALASMTIEQGLDAIHQHHSHKACLLCVRETLRTSSG
jgi:hypothetical protein